MPSLFRPVLAPAVALAVALGFGAAPAVAGDAPSAVSVPALEAEKYRLPNGLEVILHRDASLPRVAVSLWYHVGPANEPAGRSGFAHLFEHLMFEGSKHVGRRFDTLLESAGATNVNGTTSWDRTNYYETVPREHLELVLWIESDRMGYMLDNLTAERLEVQRDVVQNERRQTFENAPYGPSSLTLLDTLFPKGHPYHGAIIGSMADLEAAKMTDVTGFFRDYYAPSNATLALAGDFEPGAARKLVERYFGSLPDRPKPARNTRTTPALDQEIRVTVEEPVELPKVAMGWITPPAFAPDDVALEVLAAVLAGGKATRLYRSLVVEKKLAGEVESELESSQLASVLTVSAVVASGKDPKRVEAAIDQVLAELGRKGPSAAELERARRRILVDLMSNLQLLNGRDGESGRAGLLQRFNHYLGDPGYLPTYLERLRAVSADDVRRVASQHLDPKKRVVVVTQPKPGSKP